MLRGSASCCMDVSILYCNIVYCKCFVTFFLFILVTTCFGPLDHLQLIHTNLIRHLTIQRIFVFLFILLFFACCAIFFYSSSIESSFKIFYFKVWHLKFKTFKFLIFCNETFLWTLWFVWCRNYHVRWWWMIVYFLLYIVLQLILTF
jgi:hypothetical protein